MNVSRAARSSLLFALCLMASAAQAQLVLINSFNAGVGQLVAAAFDQTTDTVWVHGGFDADLRQYSRAGVFMTSISRPGESANDFDLEIAPEPLSLAGTSLPAGTLLAINGENDAAEIYAVDKSSGSVLATLNTAAGASHIVGGAYHPARNTFFLVQDAVPSGTANDNAVAEIDPATGAILNQFKVDDAAPGYTIDFGDVEVHAATGNLLFVTSDESTIAELTPAGAFVQLRTRPSGPSSLSGIGIDDARGEMWVSGTGGTVWRLGGLAAIDNGDFDRDGDVDGADFLLWQTTLGPTVTPGDAADGNASGVVDADDLAIWQDQFGQATAAPHATALPEPMACTLAAFAVLVIQFHASRARTSAFSG